MPGYSNYILLRLRYYVAEMKLNIYVVVQQLILFFSFYFLIFFFLLLDTLFTCSSFHMVYKICGNGYKIYF